MSRSSGHIKIGSKSAHRIKKNKEKRLKEISLQQKITPSYQFISKQIKNKSHT